MAEKPNIELIRSELTESLDQNIETVKKIMNIPPNKDVLLREFIVYANNEIAYRIVHKDAVI